MSENALYIQLLNLFTTDDNLEVLVAACITRMTDFSTLCEEKNRQDAELIDSDLELTSPQGKRLNAIYQALLTYPIEFNQSRADSVDATVGMLINDREVPFFVIENLRTVVNRLVAKNGLVLTAEANTPAATYVGEDGVMLDNTALGLLAFKEFTPADNGFLKQYLGQPAPEGTELDPSLFEKPVTDSYLLPEYIDVQQLDPFQNSDHGGSRTQMFASRNPQEVVLSEKLQAAADAAGSMTGVSDVASKVEEE